MVKTLLLSSFSRAINMYLGLDAESAQRLQALEGKTATIEWLPFHVIFQCQFSTQGVQVYEGECLQANVKISGTPLQMMGMMFAKDARHHFFANELMIEGDAQLGQQIIALFDELQWDGEEYLSRLVGDVPAYHAGRLMRHINTWLCTAKNSFIDNVNEYVHEEADWFPSKEALSDFFTDIDILRMDTDRLEARINRLKDQWH
jgi:ubiquinone biosynthesis protein UbiJ